MNSQLNTHLENDYPIHFYIHLFFVFIGFIIYIMAILLFKYYFNNISFIKREIFTYIILNSFKSFLDITLSESFVREIIIYIFDSIEFYLILSYINKCLSSKKLAQDTSSYELEYLYYFIFVYMIVFFPYEETLNLSGKLAFSYNTLKISLSILLFRYISIRMQLLLEYLKEKKMATSTIPDIYLPYMKAQFYYTKFNIINYIFDLILGLVIIYYLLKILDLFIIWKIISIYLILIFEESIYCSLIVSNLLFFYSFNKKRLLKWRRRKKREKTEEEVNLSKYGVTDIDIQQDENNNNPAEKEKSTIKEQLDKEDNNTNEEKNTANEKAIEESESLK